MHRLVLGLLGLVALGALACSSYGFAVPSTGGKAFVTGSHFLGQSMYLCDASSGKPVCKELEEK